MNNRKYCVYHKFGFTNFRSKLLKLKFARVENSIEKQFALQISILIEDDNDCITLN